MFKLPLIKYIKKYPIPFVIQAISGIIYNILIAYAIVLLGKVIDAALTSNFTNILISIGIYISILLFYMFCRLLKRYYVRDFAVLMEMDMRIDIFNSIINKNSTELEHDKVGELMSRTGEDVTKVTETIRKTVTEIWDTWLLMISYFVSMLTMNSKITLIASICIPISIIIAQLIRKPLYKYSKQYSKLSGKISVSLQQTLLGIPTLRLFGAEEQKKNELDELCNKQATTNLKLTILQSAMQPIYIAIASIGIIIIIIMGGKEVISGEWLIGTFWSFLTIFTAMAARTPTAAKVFNMWHSGEAAWERIKDQLGNVNDIETLSVPPIDSINIRINNLSFKYPLGSKEVINNITFNVNYNQIIGITGPIGCGKTALCLSLTGIFDYKGNIEINGRELRDMSKEEKSKIISYLGHEPHLFSSSIKDNITMNFSLPELKVDEAKLEFALFIACLEDDLKLMEKGVETLIGERGVQISGGQKQRIALARAIYQDRPLLLLDDPFSALDILTEQKILERIKQLKFKTIIIFSHRLEAFKTVDQIILLHNGYIKEKGSHEELVKQNSIYKQIYFSQGIEGE